MSLRTRLLLGYGYLVVLLFICSISAAIGFHSLGMGIDSILTDNFDSVHASVGMLAAIERQDSAILSSLLDPSVGAKDLSEAEADFKKELLRSKKNITVKKEREVIDSISILYENYRKKRGQLLSSLSVPALQGERLAIYRASVFPAFEKTKSAVLSLLDLNHEAMRNADVSARKTAMRSSVWLGTLVLLALVSMVVLSRRLQSGLLSRLGELREFSESVARGDTSRRLRFSGRDELSRIAQHLNDSLDAQDSLKREMQGRVSQQHLLALGLLGVLGDGAQLLDLDGTLLAPISDDSENAPLPVMSWIRQHGLETLRSLRAERGKISFAIRLESYVLRLLVAQGQHPVGWLVTVDG